MSVKEHLPNGTIPDFSTEDRSELTEEQKRRMRNGDFAVGAHTQHLSLPGGLPRTDKKGQNGG